MQNTPKNKKNNEWAQFNTLDANQNVIEQPGARQSSNFANRLGLLVRLGFSLLNWALMVRIIFKVVDANERQAFAGRLISITDPFVEPFVGIMRDIPLDDILFEGDRLMANASLETAAVIAVIVYWIVGLLAARFLKALFAPQDEIMRMG